MQIIEISCKKNCVKQFNTSRTKTPYIITMKPPDMYTLWCYSNHLHTVLYTLLSIKISDNSAPIWLKSANKFRLKKIPPNIYSYWIHHSQPCPIPIKDSWNHKIKCKRKGKVSLVVIGELDVNGPPCLGHCIWKTKPNSLFLQASPSLTNQKPMSADCCVGRGS